MPMLTTLRMRLPVWPFQSPLRTRCGEGGHPVEHRVDLGHHVLAVDDDRRALRRAQRHVQHRAVLGDVDPLAAEHGVDARRAARTRSASCTSSAQRLVGDAVLRVVEVDAGRLEREPLAARGIVGEQLAQVASRERGVVRGERLPRGPGRKRRRRGRHGYPSDRVRRCVAGRRLAGGVAARRRVRPQAEAAGEGVGVVAAGGSLRRQLLRLHRVAAAEHDVRRAAARRRAARPRRPRSGAICFLPSRFERAHADVVLERRLAVGQVGELHRHQRCRRRSAPSRGRCRGPGTASCRPGSCPAPASRRR